MKTLTLALLAVVLCCSSVYAQSGAAPQPQQTPSAQKPNDANAEEIKLWIDLIGAEAQARLYALAPEANKDRADPTGKIAEIYSKIVRSPELTRALLAQQLKDYLKMREGARSAPQVSQSADEANIKLQTLQIMQNQAIIEQNQRIVSLLEQLVKKGGTK